MWVCWRFYHFSARNTKAALQPRAKYHVRSFVGQSGSDTTIDEVINAVRNMAHTKTGALIVFARRSSLQDLVDFGVKAGFHGKGRAS